MKATVDLDGLEQDLNALFEAVKKQVREIQAGDESADPHKAAGIMATAVMLEGMGEILRVLGQRIEEPAARQRFLKLQQRFAGFKGAARGAMNEATRRVQEELKHR
jgi:hypothetical protein